MADSPNDVCYGCGKRVNLTRLVVKADGMRQVWHIGCYNAVQEILTLEKLRESDADEEDKSCRVVL